LKNVNATKDDTPNLISIFTQYKEANEVNIRCLTVTYG